MNHVSQCISSKKDIAIYSYVCVYTHTHTHTHSGILYLLNHHFHLKSTIKHYSGGQDGGGVGRHGVPLSPWIHQGYIFRHRRACRTPAESRQEDLISGKEYIEPRKTWYAEGTRGKNTSIGKTGPTLGRWGKWSRSQILTAGRLSESE